MKTIIKQIILFIFLIGFTFSPILARALEIPSLSQVMQQNSQKQKQTQEKIPEPQKIEIEVDTGTKIEEEINETLPDETLPREFSYQILKDGENIDIFKANESAIFVQKINLKGNNQIQSLLSDPVSFNEKTGEPQFVRHNIDGLVELAEKTPISIISGQFFNGNTNPTELSLGLKSDGIVRSAGADNRGRAKKIITIINGQAKILDYSWENLDNRTGDFAIVGFDFSVANRSESRIGRNYICLPNPSNRNTSHSLITLTAVEINEEEALQEMQKYGCTQQSILKLDGGGSARFWNNGITTYGYTSDKPDYRTIPHGLAFYER